MCDCGGIDENLESLGQLDFNMYNKDFLRTWDKSDDDLMAVLNVADALESLRKDNIDTRIFKSGLAVSQFRDNSTRTRFSFASAANLLGLAVQDLDEGKSQISHGETVRETANMISFLTDVIGIRDDMYIGRGHTYQKDVADALDEGFMAGVLPQRPAVINLQCDEDHPTQSMADLLHLANYFGGVEGLRGRKIAMTWAYSPSYGKPLSVPQGIITLMTRFGMEVSLAHPEGYDLMPHTMEIAKKNAELSGGKFTVCNSMEEAFEGADIVYPKSWAPFSIMEERTVLMNNKDTDGLKELEKKCLANNAKFQNWECTEKLMEKTADGEALYMHCLPADISGVSCKAGEVAASVFEKYRLDTYAEAGHKPYIIAAMILLCRFRDPAAVLNMIRRRAIPRVGL